MRIALALLALSVFCIGARAEEPFSTSITLRNHRFEPAETHVPAGRRILLHLKNEDPLSEEFDSSALKVEKVFAGNSEGIIRISPLDKGRYEFMGEYHSDTAKGVVIAE
ncbi:MAG TPA: cupredoxin domain-containing protein [Pseudolabrys sp.]|nr:cupredoxin domain-containing protein [Pseudolabrys sp.]